MIIKHPVIKHPVISSIFKTIVFTWMISASCVANATNYYVGAHLGDDSNPGTIARPWKTIDKINLMMSAFLPGDSILLHAGDTLHGTLTMTVSGNVAYPIVFASYGNGSRPVITGASPVEGWQLFGVNIWRAYFLNDLSDRVTNVFINDISQEIGRYPNAGTGSGVNGYGTISSNNGTSFVDNSLPAGIDFSGAELVTKVATWTSSQTNVVSTAGNTVSINPSLGLVNGWGYIIRNHLSTLDSQGEWFYDTAAHYLYLYSTVPPSNLLVTATNLGSLFVAANKANIIISGLSFIRAQNDNAVSLKGCTNMSISNCGFYDNSGNVVSIFGNSSAIALDGCDFNNNTLNCIYLFGSNHITISNNRMNNTGLRFGMVRNNQGQNNGSGINYAFITNMDIGNNTISKTGYCGIFGYGAVSSVIHDNLVDSFTMLYDDGGGIYTETNYNNNLAIGNNIVQNGVGSNEGTSYNKVYSTIGIYLDNGCQNTSVYNNTVLNPGNTGILLNNGSTANNVYGNTVFGGNVPITVAAKPDNLSSTNNVHDNILLTDGFEKSCLKVTGSVTAAYGSIDHNAYCNPFNASMPVVAAGTTYHLAGWQSYSGKDINSNTSPITLPLFAVTGYNGTNKVGNAYFNTGIAGWSAGIQGNGSGTVAWDPNGYLKLSYTVAGAFPSWLSARTSIGNISAGQQYIVRFVYKADVANIGISVMLWYSKSNIFTGLTSKTTWQRDSMLLTSNTNGTAQLSIEAGNPNIGSLYIDSVELIPVTATPTKFSDYVKIYVNYSAIDSIIHLGSGNNYSDAFGHAISSGTLTVGPRSSKTVFRKMPGQIFLAVRLKSFKATTNGCTANLAWQSASEPNSSHYVVEASTDASAFAQVAKVASQNSAMGSTYEYSCALGSGTTYFRLRMVDVDGRLSYSSIVSVTGTGACGAGMGITVWPNPASNLVNIQHLDGGRNLVSVFDMNGRKMTGVLATGTSQIINIGMYAKGVYMLCIENASGKLATVMMVKQ